MAFRHPMTQRNSQRGFYLIGLLLVLLIIIVLMLKGPFGPGSDTKSQVTTAQMSLNRANTSVCASNRLTLQTNLINWRMTHLGETPTIEKIRQSGINISSCPHRGAYLLGPDGAVYCTEHNPPPAEQLSQMITLTAAPTPVPTSTFVPPVDPYGHGKAQTPPATTPAQP